ncbi:MAG: prepilin peptidase [Lentisphaeria bacterium]
MQFTENISLLSYFFVSSFAFGCIVGSFLNVVVWRLPRGESLCHPPSHCPRCGHMIRAWENIPILSWLVLRRRCSACHLPISWHYPAGEAAVGLLYAGIFWHLLRGGLPLAVLPGYFWLAGAVLSAARIDAEKYIIPNKITYSGMLAAFLLALVFPKGRLILHRESLQATNGLFFQEVLEKLNHWEPLAGFLQHSSAAAALDCVLGMLIGGSMLALFAVAGKLLCYKQKRESEAVGYGDVKFLAMIGAFLGADAAVYILLGGAMLGFLFGLIKWARKKNIENIFSSLPFAPFLAVPVLFWLLVGNWFYLFWHFFYDKMQ